MDRRVDDSLELARRARDGDSEAFRTLLDAYRDRLLARIRLFLGPRARRAADSGDFLQGVFVEALDGFDRGHGPRDERAFLRWLTTIARNNIADSVRRQREQNLASMSSILMPSTVGARGPATRAELGEDLHLLLEAIEVLEPDHRRVVELRALEGLRFAEVAREMQRSEDAARKLFRRALTRLGKELEERTT